MKKRSHFLNRNWTDDMRVVQEFPVVCLYLVLRYILLSFEII